MDNWIEDFLDRLAKLQDGAKNISYFTRFIPFRKLIRDSSSGWLYIVAYKMEDGRAFAGKVSVAQRRTGECSMNLNRPCFCFVEYYDGNQWSGEEHIPELEDERVHVFETQAFMEAWLAMQFEAGNLTPSSIYISLRGALNFTRVDLISMRDSLFKEIEIDYTLQQDPGFLLDFGVSKTSLDQVIAALRMAQNSVDDLDRSGRPFLTFLESALSQMTSLISQLLALTATTGDLRYFPAMQIIQGQFKLISNLSHHRLHELNRGAEVVEGARQAYATIRRAIRETGLFGIQLGGELIPPTALTDSEAAAISLHLLTNPRREEAVRRSLGRIIPPTDLNRFINSVFNWKDHEYGSPSAHSAANKLLLRSLSDL